MALRHSPAKTGASPFAGGSGRKPLHDFCVSPASLPTPTSAPRGPLHPLPLENNVLATVRDGPTHPRRPRKHASPPGGPG